MHSTNLVNKFVYFYLNSFLNLSYFKTIYIVNFCSFTLNKQIKQPRLNAIKQDNVSLCQESAQLYNNRLEPSRMAPNTANCSICFYMFNRMLYNNSIFRKFAIKSACKAFVLSWHSPNLRCSKRCEQWSDICITFVG